MSRLDLHAPHGAYDQKKKMQDFEFRCPSHYSRSRQKNYYSTSHGSAYHLHCPIRSIDYHQSIQYLSILTLQICISSRNQFQIQFKSNRETNQHKCHNNPSKMNQQYGPVSLGLFQAELKWISTYLQFVSV